MHKHALLLSVTLALAASSAASAMQSPAGESGTSAVVAQSATQQAGPADTRVAIILQRKPAKKSGK